MSNAVLTVENLQAGYESGIPIVRGVTFEVLRAEIVAVLGPNGAGKSTLIKAIVGLLPKFSGTVRLLGRDITTVKTHDLARGGLGYVPQTENVFSLMTVADNLRIAADTLAGDERLARIDAMYHLFPDLSHLRRLHAGRLSGGQRQMLAIARALITMPHILLLDEASAGLSPKLVGEVFSKLLSIRDHGVTVLIVEQNARAALEIADRALILSEGKIVRTGPSRELANDRAIGRVFLGLAPEDGAA
jgi:branched-chain amino acid transport system ATP-binding protein